MINKNFFLFFYFLIIFFFNGILFASINIEIRVNDEIITNIDIEKEAEYLKILNPNLSQLNNEKIKELAKISLINEIIKKRK